MCRKIFTGCIILNHKGIWQPVTSELGNLVDMPIIVRLVCLLHITWGGHRQGLFEEKNHDTQN